MIVCLVCVCFASYASASLSDGLVAYYPFNGNAYDASGNHNNGLVRGPSLTKDRFGNSNSAYLFDGQRDYIEVPDSDLLDIKKDISITGWFKVNSFSSEWLTIINKAASDSNDTFEISINRSKYLHFPLMLGAGNRTAYNTTNIVMQRKWHFFAVVYSGEEVRMYIDGKLNRSYVVRNKPLHTNDHNLIIGAEKEHVNGPHFFNGIIDDIRLYNRAISASEASKLYAIKNIALYKPIRLNGNFFQGGWHSAVTPKTRVDIIPTDNVFFPEHHEWDINTIWWSDRNSYITIDLDNIYWIESVILQGDCNDNYQISVHKYDSPQNIWTPLCIPENKPEWWGMKTSPQVVLKKFILADAIKIQAVGGDNLFSIGEIQVFGYKPTISGCVTLGNLTLEQSSATLIQSGEIFQKRALSKNGCYFFDSFAPGKPFSIITRKSDAAPLEAK